MALSAISVVCCGVRVGPVADRNSLRPGIAVWSRRILVCLLVASETRGFQWSEGLSPIPFRRRIGVGRTSACSRFWQSKRGAHRRHSAQHAGGSAPPRCVARRHPRRFPRAVLASSFHRRSCAIERRDSGLRWRGVAFLTPSGDGADNNEEEPFWVNDILDLSYHNPLADDERMEAFVFSKSSNSAEWVSSIAPKVKVCTFSHSTSGGGFKAEVYVHQLPKHDCTIWWCAPWFQEAIFGSDLHNRWICWQYSQWQNVIPTGSVWGGDHY